jgi:hypothetical protein
MRVGIDFNCNLYMNLAGDDSSISLVGYQFPLPFAVQEAILCYKDLSTIVVSRVLDILKEDMGIVSADSDHKADEPEAAGFELGEWLKLNREELLFCAKELSSIAVDGKLETAALESECDSCCSEVMQDIRTLSSHVRNNDGSPNVVFPNAVAEYQRLLNRLNRWQELVMELGKLEGKVHQDNRAFQIRLLSVASDRLIELRSIMRITEGETK